MKHKGIIKRIGHLLSQGYGINEACAELGLTPDYLSKRCKRIDRVRLHQSHQIFREGLQREITQRARLGRPTGQLERALDNLPLLSLPGDDEDQERADRKRSRRNFEDVDDGIIIDDGPHNGFTNFLPETISGIREEDCKDFNDDDVDVETAVEATPAPRPEPAPTAPTVPSVPLVPKPAPAPEPVTHWFRLFTGRAQLRDEDGKIIKSLLPGHHEYPHESEFVNWN